jgi:hypothetical protein
MGHNHRAIRQSHEEWSKNNPFTKADLAGYKNMGIGQQEKINIDGGQ